MSDDARQRFSECYAALYGRVRAYAARRVGPDAADEVAAETFTIAWRRSDVIPAEPLPWLYGMTRNVVARHRVSLARQAELRFEVDLVRYGTTSSGASPAHPRRASSPPTH